MVNQLRKEILERFAQAELRQSTWRPHWQELNDWIQPRRARMLDSDANNGTKRNGNIINATASHAKGVAQAGLTAGLTSAARPWMKLGTADPRLSKLSSVKQYLADSETQMYAAWARSNFYTEASGHYGDLLQFGSGTFHMEPDPKTTLRCYKFPVGQFYFASDARGEVCSVFRKFQMTVSQVVERFGIEKCTFNVQKAWNENKRSEPVMILHVIEPNRMHDRSKLGWQGKAYISFWLELVADQTAGFLMQKGFDQLRTRGVRWDVDGEDDYGSSPGMESLGDVKALQILEKEKLKLVQKLADPPMKGPATLKNGRVGLMPGDYTGIGANEAELAPAQIVNPAGITALRAEIEAHEFRINRSFKADLWLMLTQGTDVQKTAREIVARESEKMLQLGPVLERLFTELLKPVVEITFAICLEQGLMPKPPPEMEGQEIKVEFISALAVSMKLLGITAYERFSGFVMQWDAVDPSLKDKVNRDKLVEDYAERVGIPPDIIRSEDEVDAMREARAKAQAEAAQAEQLAQTAPALKQLSETSLEGDTAASRLVDVLGGPQPGIPGGVA